MKIVVAYSGGLDTSYTVMYLSNQLTDKSHVQIGLNIGNRNHATVIHAIKQIKDMMEVDEKTQQDVEELTNMLRAK